MQFQHRNNAQNGEFFLDNEQGKRIAEISYRWRDQHQIIADHTWVDDALRGQGIARQLLDELVQFSRENNLKIVPACSYVASVFQQDPSLADVAA
ncbi:GNAT family N-acetyltransferase [Acinetobacter sp. WZC-1]|uniref:GNAT family N-acetyltransferase n=1 Tax=Acinetobacter sp. WZC-1 TaxID=3459034 RepID=UPI00403D71A3